MLSIVIISILLTGMNFVPLSIQGEIQEEFLPQTQTYREISVTLDSIENNLKSIEPDTGIPQLDRLRTNCLTLKSESKKDTVSAINRLIYKINLLTMALNFYNGNLDQAESNAITVFKTDPSTTLSGNIATAELAMWFEDLRGSKVGSISIFSEPSNSQVFLDDKCLGYTPLEHIFAPLGEYEIRISRNGYTTWVDQILITKEKTNTIHAELRLNTGSLLFWISPVGSEIKIDSEIHLKETEPLDLSLYPLVLAFGLDPSQLSQPVIIHAIKPGSRTISLTRDCYSSVDYYVNVAIGDYILPPVCLQSADSYISITSKHSGKTVKLDDIIIGRTPLQNYRVCPGKHRLSVEFDNNFQWSQVINPREGDQLTFDAFPRPSILFIGCASTNTGLAIEGTYPLTQWFDTSKQWNLIDRKQYLYRPAVAAVLEKMARPDFTVNDPNWMILLDNMRASLMDSNASIIAVAHLVTDRSNKKSHLYILNPSAGQPDEIELPGGIPESQPPEEFLSFLDAPILLKRLRSGLRVTTCDDKLVLSEIIPGGPAENSPLKTGDIILSIADKKITCSKDFEELLQNPKSEETMSITVSRENRNITALINMSWQPFTLPLKDPSIPYNLINSRLVSEIVNIGDRPELYLNAGICNMAFDRPDKALEYFNLCYLADEQGLNNGTLLFLKYLAENAQGNSTAANMNYEAARDAPGSTIIHGDGPLLIDVLR